MIITAVLSKHYPDAEWSLDGDDYSGLVWNSDIPKPTEKELESLWPAVEHDLLVQNVSQSRAAAYAAPGGSDGIFFKYQRGEATEQEWLDAVTEINARYPYPVS